jgi:hypothetical protein
MTWTLPRNDNPEPSEPGSVASTATYEALCRRTRALQHDASFLALVRRPGTHLNDAVRLALDAVPALELLPLQVLVEELRAVLNRAKHPEPAPVVRVWLA